MGAEGQVHRRMVSQNNLFLGLRKADVDNPKSFCPYSEMAADKVIAAMMAILVLMASPATSLREPDGAFSRMSDDTYVPRGEVDVIGGDLPIYIARSGLPNVGKMVVWGHDIFGWKSGRTKELVDRLAEETELNVILPDLFRGLERPPAETYQWDTSLQVSTG